MNGFIILRAKNRKLLAGMARICYIITNGNRFDWVYGNGRIIYEVFHMGKERFVDLIQKKKNGETLTKEEIDFMITDYVAG